MAEEDEKGYRWETEYEKTWEVIEEDDDGTIQSSVDDIVHKAKRRRLLEKLGNIRLGMMRHLFLVIDMSEAMKDQDLKPTRLASTLKLLEHFVEEYFDQNPISQLGVITTRNKRAEKVAELGGNPRRHITTLQSLVNKTCQGEPSLQNSLDLANQTLRHMPSHASREVLIVLGSLTSCDPGDISETIQTMKDNNVRCSVIGLAAEVRVCKRICHETSGKYFVILDEVHFRDLLISHVTPPPATSSTESSLIKMGFPHHNLSGDKGKGEKASMCMCHLDSKVNQGFSSSGYFCPQCKSKYCELPIECKSCGLTLVSAPHLARSYHHLFPLETFVETPVSSLSTESTVSCFSCQITVEDPNMYQCGRCHQLFCLDCDLYIHETLHSCPGCACSRETQQSSQQFVGLS
ncbi:general transcription factor IIH subunit 2-like isoform X1 [Argopecten irradians]|uniref:general transcription factor IIH subunit 2-like isoform X1 n=2 Tax=Argopecten irradians TaxID=31199 RepID=UPI0037156870